MKGPIDKARRLWAGLSFKRILLYVVLAQATLIIGLLVYLTATDEAVVLEIAPRDELRVAETDDRLIIPVAGVHASELTDSFGAPRSGGRSHSGIDILAPDGTDVLAAASGIIVGLESSELGGISLYQRDLDGRTIYFYAHLKGYRPGLKEGDFVQQGDVIAYVGQTGNAPVGTPHLHFAVYTVSDPNHWYRGRHLSPCDLLPCGVQEESVEE